MMLMRGRLGAQGWAAQVRHQEHRRGVIARATVKSTSSARQLLDSFWEARGVLDPVHRKLLVEAAESLDVGGAAPLDSAPLAADAPLPGISATWQLLEATPEVLAASRRLLALQQMLGGGVGGGGQQIDVVWMVVREPQLLSADLSQITGRLLDMKLATYGMDGVNVLKVVESQPGLLLSDRWRLDLESLQEEASVRSSQPTATSSSSVFSSSSSPRPSSANVSSSPASPSSASTSPTSTSSPMPPSGANYAVLTPAVASNSSNGNGSNGNNGGRAEAQVAAASSEPGSGSGSPSSSSGSQGSAVEQMVSAWGFGIASDDDREWASWLVQLSAYQAAHGDSCVGFRDEDDRELARWATKQRSDWRRGRLAEERHAALASLDFLFEADEAEWVRWFAELRSFQREAGHSSPMPLATGVDMYLINWCSVQRIARRSRVLSESRIARLDELGFDWTGADPLS